MHNEEIDKIDKNKPDDLFICSASFEDRSLGGISHLSDDYHARRSIIYYNSDFYNNKEKNLIENNINMLEEKLSDHSDKIKMIKGKKLNAYEQFQSIFKSINECYEELEDINNISIDITTFTRETLIVLIAVLNNVTNFNSQLIYSSPQEHGDWLSRGFRNVRNILGFPGVHNSNKPTLLVILSGFEPDRTTKLIEEYEPTKVLLGFGNPPTKKKFYKRNIKEQKLVRARQIVEEFNFSASSIIESKRDIEEKINPYLNEYNIILAPMSTKLSTIATYLIAEKNPSIQLVYSLVGEYNLNNYSKGVEDVYTEKYKFIDHKICKA